MGPRRTRLARTACLVDIVMASENSCVMSWASYEVGNVVTIAKQAKAASGSRNLLRPGWMERPP